MKNWKLTGNPELRPILEYCLRAGAADRLILALRQKNLEGDFLYPATLPATERLFGARILERRKGRRWPGTVSHRFDCLLVVVRFDEELVTPMVEAGPKLFDWVGSPKSGLPEDLCLYRAGSTWPVLVSVTHEQDAWIFAEEEPSSLEVSACESETEDLFIPRADVGFIESE